MSKAGKWNRSSFFARQPAVVSLGTAGACTGRRFAAFSNPGRVFNGFDTYYLLTAYTPLYPCGVR